MENLDFINCFELNDSEKDDLLVGLQSNDQKKLNSKYLYDKKGSELFDKITKLKEYYPTKKELEILENKTKEIKNILPSNSVVIEFGSGSNNKIKKFLKSLESPEEYIPIDISKEFLFKNAKELATNFPKMKITAICADFNNTEKLSRILKEKKSKIGFFPGSTIGNFCPDEAKNLLLKFSKILGENNYLVVGVDLKKDIKVIEQAYNDSNGVTAEFNKNILNGVNNLYGSGFDEKNFKHRAFFNNEMDRIEMHLVSKKKQHIKIRNKKIIIEDGESIHTENSYKYSIKKFSDLVNKSGYEIKKVLTDKNSFFSIFLLRVSTLWVL